MYTTVSQKSGGSLAGWLYIRISASWCPESPRASCLWRINGLKYWLPGRTHSHGCWQKASVPRPVGLSCGLLGCPQSMAWQLVSSTRESGRQKPQCLFDLTLEVIHSHLCRFLKFSWGDTFTDFGERERNIVFLPPVCSLTGDQTWSLLVYGMILQPTEPPSKGTFAMFWWLHRLIRIYCGKAFDTIWTSAGRIIGGHPVCWLPWHRFICRNARVAYKTWSMVVVIDLHENIQPN